MDRAPRGGGGAMTALWFAVLLAVADPPAQALGDDAYRFCHEAGADAVTAGAWCELLEGAPPDRCPGLRETCAGVVGPPTDSGGCSGPSPGGGAPSKRGTAGAPDRPDKPWQPEACQLPEARLDLLGALLKWVGAIAVALAVLVVLRVLWAYLGNRREPPPTPTPVDVAVVAAAPEPDEAVPELPGDDLLASARRALAAGDFAGAVLFARAAALRGLADRGLLKLHRARTDREYARTVRGRDDLYAALREILGAVEVHRWGGAPLDQARSHGAVEAAARLLRALGAAVLVAVLAVDDARAQSDRYGPDGDAALRDLLVAWGHDAGFRLRGFASLDETTDAIVLDTTYVEPDEEGWAALRVWVEAGGVLVVAGPNGVAELGTHVPLDVDRDLVGLPILRDLLLPVPRLPGGPAHAFQGGLGEPWVVVDGPDGESFVAVEVLPLGEGVVVGIADPRLLWNGALVHPDNERFLGDLFHAGQGALGWPLPPRARVELATTAAAESPSPSSSILNADLLPFVAQLLATWALLGLSLGIPFALLRDPPEEGRIAFSDHVRALGTRWWRLRASRHALAAYGGVWLQRLGPGGLRHAAIRAGRDPWRADELVAAVQRAVEDPGGPDDARDFEWMEELWTITRGR